MSELIVVDRKGAAKSVPAKPGFSIMEIIRDSGSDELLALCGGCCSCATCHVYVDPALAALLPPMTDDENDLLDGSEHRRADSRLSCQLRFAENMTGQKVTIAPED